MLKSGTMRVRGESFRIGTVEPRALTVADIQAANEKFYSQGESPSVSSVDGQQKTGDANPRLAAINKANADFWSPDSAA